MINLTEREKLILHRMAANSNIQNALAIYDLNTAYEESYTLNENKYQRMFPMTRKHLNPDNNAYYIYPYDITHLLVKLGIDPLKYVNKVVPRMFTSVDLNSDVVIPDNVGQIERRGFFKCSQIHSVKLPTTIDMIGPLAFAGCSNLDVIYYDGTKEEFKVIKKYNEWVDHAITIKCRDGDMTYTPKL